MTGKYETYTQLKGSAHVVTDEEDSHGHRVAVCDNGPPDGDGWMPFAAFANIDHDACVCGEVIWWRRKTIASTEQPEVPQQQPQPRD